MSDREIREAERRAKADPSDEAAAERARALRWRTGRPTVADRLAAILSDPEVMRVAASASASHHWPPESVEAILVAAAPFASGAFLADRLEVLNGLARVLGWLVAPDVAAWRIWGTPERKLLARAIGWRDPGLSESAASLWARLDP